MKTLKSINNLLNIISICGLFAAVLCIALPYSFYSHNFGDSQSSVKMFITLAIIVNMGIAMLTVILKYETFNK